MKTETNALGHLTKIAAMPMYVKTFKNLLQNKLFDCFSTTKIIAMVTFGRP